MSFAGWNILSGNNLGYCFQGFLVIWKWLWAELWCWFVNPLCSGPALCWFVNPLCSGSALEHLHVFLCGGVIFVLFTHDGFYVTSCIGLFLFLFSPDGNQLDVYYQGEKKLKKRKSSRQRMPMWFWLIGSLNLAKFPMFRRSLPISHWISQ